jgi:hypothetical protein
LARHAKRITLKVEDLRLLRQLWKVIDPNSAIGADTEENRHIKEKEKEREEEKLRKEKKKMLSKLAYLRLIGRLDKFTKAEIIFLHEHKLAFV